jgi:hypothetical protein
MNADAIVRGRPGLLLALIGACTHPDDADLRLPPEMDRVLASPHFVVHTDLAAEPAEHHRRVLEGMFAWFEQNWFAVPAQPEPLRVLLFADGDRMQAWNQSQRLSPAAGRYLPAANLLVVDLDTGIGTAFHELVHYFLRCGCPHPRTPFVEEGVAAFFEKFLGHIDADGRLELTVGYFHPFRFMQLLAKYEHLHVAGLWVADGQPDYEVARSFMLFLHRHGQLVPFVRALRTATGDGRRELEAITGRTLSQLDADWHAWVAAQPFVVGGDVFLVERSLILGPTEWAQWLRDNADHLQFDEELRIWRVPQSPGAKGR